MMPIFQRRKTKLITFHTGTSGLKQHEEFINSIDKKGIRIIHAYTLFYDYSQLLHPQYLNYVISYPSKLKL